MRNRFMDGSGNCYSFKDRRFVLYVDHDAIFLRGNIHRYIIEMKAIEMFLNLNLDLKLLLLLQHET